MTFRWTRKTRTSTTSSRCQSTLQKKKKNQYSCPTEEHTDTSKSLASLGRRKVPSPCQPACARETLSRDVPKRKIPIRARTEGRRLAHHHMTRPPVAQTLPLTHSKASVPLSQLARSHCTGASFDVSSTGADKASRVAKRARVGSGHSTARARIQGPLQMRGGGGGRGGPPPHPSSNRCTSLVFIYRATGYGVMKRNKQGTLIPLLHPSPPPTTACPRPPVPDPMGRTRQAASSTVTSPWEGGGKGKRSFLRPERAVSTAPKRKSGLRLPSLLSPSILCNPCPSPYPTLLFWGPQTLDFSLPAPCCYPAAHVFRDSGSGRTHDFLVPGNPSLPFPHASLDLRISHPPPGHPAGREESQLSPKKKNPNVPVLFKPVRPIMIIWVKREREREKKDSPCVWWEIEREQPKVP